MCSIDLNVYHSLYDQRVGVISELRKSTFMKFAQDPAIAALAADSEDNYLFATVLTYASFSVACACRSILLRFYIVTLLR